MESKPNEQASSLDPPHRAVLRALINLDRLRNILAISDRALTVRAICEAVELPPDSVGMHLQMFGQAGLLTTERRGRERLYRFDGSVFATIQADLASHVKQAEIPGMTPIAASFFDGNRLTSYPSSLSKQRAVLAVLVRDFAIGQEYREREVNAILVRRHPDCASLRRALIDEGFMSRASGIYRRV